MNTGRTRQRSAAAAQISAFTVLALAGTALAQTDVVWNGAADNNWRTAANWSPANVPDTTLERPVISRAGTFIVTIAQGPAFTAGLPTFSSSGLTLRIQGGQSVGFSGSGTATNNALIELNSNLSIDAAVLSFGGSPTLTGSGSIRMFGGTNEAAGIFGTFTNSNAHAIRGSGLISANITNAGTIAAEGSGRTLRIQSSIVNSGVLSSNPGATLKIENSTIRSPISAVVGEILAPAGLVQIGGGSTIRSQILRTSGTGDIEYVSQPTLEDCVFQGTAHVVNGGFLILRGVIKNEGRLTVGDGTSSSTGLSISTGTTIAVGGGTNPSIFMNGSGPNPTILGSFTNGAGHTIRGSGTLDAALSNDGSIVADIAAETLRFLPGSGNINRGLLLATNNSTLQLTSIVNQSASGKIRAEDGADVTLNNATIIGGSIESATGGAIRCEKGLFGILDRVTIATGSQVLITANAVVTLRNTVVNNGTITLNAANAAVDEARLAFGSNSALTGNGTVILRGTGSQAVVQGSTPSIGAGITIRGSGTFDLNTLFNSGVIDADIRDRPIIIPGTVNNSGTLRATNSALLEIRGGLTSQTAAGEIAADGTGSEVLITNNSTITGGAIGGLNEGVVRIADLRSLSLNNTRITGEIHVPLTSQLTLNNSANTGGVTNNGSILINPTGSGSGTSSATVRIQQSVVGTGSFILNSGPLPADRDARLVIVGPVTIGQNQTVAGTGYLDGDPTAGWRVDGTISPSRGSSAIGQIRTTANGSLSTTSTYIVDINSASAFDQIVAENPLSLRGELLVRLSPNYVPRVGAAFDIIIGTNINSTFNSITAPPFAGGARAWTITYSPTAVTLRVVCTIDINTDGSVDINDFFSFLTLYGTGNSRADFNRDNTIDISDFFAFLTAYGTGC